MNLFSIAIHGGASAATRASERPSPQAGPCKQPYIFWTAAFIAAALYGTIAYFSLVGAPGTNPYRYYQGASANVMTIARSYARQGILALHGLQIANNPPLGRRPDVYTHWPPLFPVVLSRAFLLFGDSQTVGRAGALAGTALLLASLFLLSCTTLGRRAAIACVFALMILPAFWSVTEAVLGLNSALAFMLLSLTAFIKATSGEESGRLWAIAGSAAIAVAVLLSWEPLFLAPSLVMTALLQKRRRALKLAALYGVVGACAFALALAVNLTGAPWLGRELWQTFLYRAGLRNFVMPSASLNELPTLLLYSAHPTPGARPFLWRVAFDAFNGFGLVGLLATCGAIVLVILFRPKRECQTFMVVLDGLLGVWILWYLMMRNQVYYNPYEIALAMPAVALCLGMAFDFLAYDLRLLRRFIFPALAIVLLIPLAQFTVALAGPQPEWQDVEMSLEIGKFTGANSVVLTPLESALAVFYSRRHVVISLYDDAAVAAALEGVAKDFPGSTVYFAASPGGNQAPLQATLRAFPVVKRDPHLILLRVGVAGTGVVASAAAALRPVPAGKAQEQGP